MKYTIQHTEVMGESYVSLVRIEDDAIIPFHLKNLDFMDALKLYKEDSTVIDTINAPEVAVNLLNDYLSKSGL